MDEFLIRSDSEIGIVNSSQYSKGKAYATKDLLDEHGITYVDKYILTHYGFSLRDDLEVILSSFMTRNIYLPEPQNDDESSILAILRKTISKYNTKIILYEAKTAIRIGKVTMTPLLSTAYGEDTSVNAFSIYTHGNTMLYLSSGVLERADKDIFYDYIACSDQVIFGSHGKKYKKKLYLDNLEGFARRMVFASPNLYVTQNEMIAQTEKGCDIMSHPGKVELLK